MLFRSGYELACELALEHLSTIAVRNPLADSLSDKLVRACETALCSKVVNRVQGKLARICAENPADEHLDTDLSAVRPLSVSADPFLLERVILNLLDNSRKYRRGEIAHVRVSTEKDARGVLLKLTDDGIGVAPELLPRLFDPFWRADPARSNPAGGSGLGLAVVREAVSHLGGSVWAEAAPGGGLAVNILLKEADGHAEDSDH